MKLEIKLNLIKINLQDQALVAKSLECSTRTNTSTLDSASPDKIQYHRTQFLTS